MILYKFPFTNSYKQLPIYQLFINLLNRADITSVLLYLLKIRMNDEDFYDNKYENVHWIVANRRADSEEIEYLYEAIL